jgi:cold shock CspA family protein
MHKKTFVGKVSWFSSRKGYGFIVWEDDGEPQQDIFVHFSDIEPANPNDFRTLVKDQQVIFSIGTNRNNQPKAINVRPH